MKIALPNNIYARLFSLYFPQKYKDDIIYKPASLLSKELTNENVDIALIPSFDLLTHENFIVSKNFGISCDSLLSNANIYYAPNKKEIGKIGLFGDVSSNEIILPRIIYPEKFSAEIKISLETKPPDIYSTNVIIVGDESFKDNYFNKGMSFAEEIAEIIGFPYVNFVLASKDDELLEQFCNEIEPAKMIIDEKIDLFFENSDLSDEVKSFVKENIGSVYFELTESETFGLGEMLKLAYYHGMIENIIDIKFI
ncbi:MAG: hypothetical protein V1773_03130 [bacterium]